MNAPLIAAALSAALLSACAGNVPPRAAQTPEAMASGTATEATRARNAAVARTYDLQDGAAMADATRGLVATPHGQIRAADGRVVWDFDSFGFVQGPAPDTVNPSLWRQARLNNQAGLFKVSEGIWQLRGFDLSNLTLIEGRTGWIVVDPLTVRETAQAAMAFARQHLGDRPVSAMVFTHSHVDHFGGALALLSAGEAQSRPVPVVAPSGFMEEATSENLMAGPAMGRRAGYMYGAGLERSATGLVDNGLGKASPAGRAGILAPTLLIDQPRQELTLDGVRFVFHSVPDAEAPAELVFSLPDHKAFAGAEIVTQTLHNVYTLRGAKVRDARKWADHVDRMIDQLGDAEVLFNQHHWPVWGRARIVDFLKAHRDSYRYIHDQTVRGMNRGLTAAEIAETLRLPRSLDAQLAVHGYYGTVKHNVRAVFQHYLGWFDAHPAHLDPLPPVEAARRYVALAGGSQAAIAQARQAYADGDYRWTAELLRHVVLADSGPTEARELQARAFEQLAYQAESASWRNFYLVGARELRQGPPPARASGISLADMLPHVPTERLLEAMEARLDGPAAEDFEIAVDLELTDSGEHWALWVENAVLHHRRGALQGTPTVRLAMGRPAFLQMVSGAVPPDTALAAPGVRASGDVQALRKLLGLLGRESGNFPIVTR